MFGNFAHLVPGLVDGVPPARDVPPPTPINFPQYHPRTRASQGRRSDTSSSASGAARPPPLTTLLQGIFRPTELAAHHLEALGVHVTASASATDIIPDPAFIPDFAAWEELSADQVHRSNDSTRKPLNNGNLSPGCLIYLDRKRELTVANEEAFRTVRRLQPPKGQNHARLGNSYEFFRHLESFASYWEDTSKPATSSQPAANHNKQRNAEESENRSDTIKDASQGQDAPAESSYPRTGNGTQMPPEYRHNLVAAFLKLIAYDFGCNVSAPRTEPRLYITASITSPSRFSMNEAPAAQRTSYFTSGCKFIFRTPTTREAARAGIVDGPIAAVSARHSTTFPPQRSLPSATSTISTEAAPVLQRGFAGDRDSAIDLAREIVAAVLTAQHRARNGKTEKRFGQDAWWATKPRWGGGPGGPIGREVETLSRPPPWERPSSHDRDTSPQPDWPLRSSSGHSRSASAPQVVETSPPRGRPPPPAPSPSPRPPPSPAPSPSPSPAKSSPARTPTRPTAVAATGGSESPAPIPVTISMPAAARLDLPTNMRRAPMSIGDGQLTPSGRGPKRLRRSPGPGSRQHQQLPIYDGYRAVRPPGPAWDKKTRYEAIGRRRGADYDDVFVISSLFHHVAVLRVRVPDRLLEVLDGALEDQEQPGRSWGLLQVWRSPWYDLFKGEDRVEGMRLVWAMMAWLMREDELAKTEVPKGKGS